MSKIRQFFLESNKTYLCKNCAIVENSWSLLFQCALFPGYNAQRSTEEKLPDMALSSSAKRRSPNSAFLCFFVYPFSSHFSSLVQFHFGTLCRWFANLCFLFYPR